MENLQNFSDKKLYQLCQEYGSKARFWSRRFAVLLPEVQRRGIYRKYGFYSIFEFAAKLAGLNKETVSEILRVSKNLEDKPLLNEQMGEQGWSKLRVVAKVVTKESEKFWTEKVQQLSKKTLEAYVQEFKKNQSENYGAHPLAKKQPKNSLPGEGIFYTQISLKLDKTTEFRLRLFRQQLEKERKETVTLGETIKILLEKANIPVC